MKPDPATKWSPWERVGAPDVSRGLTPYDFDMRILRLNDYCITRGAEDAAGDGVWIWAKGERGYFEKLQNAFPEIGFEWGGDVKSERFDWCGLARRVNSELEQQIERCLQVFQRTLWVETPLDDCFALGWHSKSGSAGKSSLTALGQWVSMAKSYSLDPHSQGDRQMAGLIADQMVEFIGRHPLYRSCAGMVAVPASNPEKAFDLPTVLCKQIEEDCGLPFWGTALFKTRITAQMKRCPMLADKRDNILNSIGVKGEIVAGKRVLIVDDILESSVTLAETCRILRRVKPTALYGLTATKTLKRGRYE